MLLRARSRSGALGIPSADRLCHRNCANDGVAAPRRAGGRDKRVRPTLRRMRPFPAELARLAELSCPCEVILTFATGASHPRGTRMPGILVQADMLPARRSGRREFLIGAAVALILGCVAFFFGLRWLESLMTFRPERMTEQEYKAAPAGAELAWLPSSPGVHLR